MSVFRKIRLFNESAENGLTEVDAIVLNPEGTIEDTIDDTTAAVSDIGTQVIVDNNTDLSNALEAVLEDPEASETIQEGVMSNLWERVKKFFEKIISFLKGVVQKIKVKLGMYTKDATKFMNSYKQAIDIAKKENKTVDYKITFEFYEGLLDPSKYADIKEVTTDIKTTIGQDNDMTIEALKTKGSSVENSDIDTEMNDHKKKIDDSVEDSLKKTTQDLDSSKVSTCVRFIEGFNSDNSKVEKEYKELLDNLNKLQRTAEAALKKYEKGREKSKKDLKDDALNTHQEETDETVKGANVAIYRIKEAVKVFNTCKSTEIGLRNKLRANAMAALRKHVSGWKKK